MTLVLTAFRPLRAGQRLRLYGKYVITYQALRKIDMEMRHDENKNDT